MLMGNFVVLLWFQTMACLLQPIGTCAEYLNVMRFSAFLSQAEKKTLTYVTEIADNELKQKVGHRK